MNSSSSVELSLSLKPSYVPKSLSNLLIDLSKIYNESDKLSVLSDYICKHQEELSKVEAVKHELPQCRLLLMEAIETLKEEFMNIKNNMESRCGQPDLVEYLPTKRKNNEKEQSEIWEITYSNSNTEEYQYCNPSLAKKKKSLILDNFQPPYFEAIQPCKEYGNIEGLLSPYKKNISNSLGSSSTGKEKEVAAMDQSSRNYNQGFFHLINTDDQTLNYHPKPLTQPIWKNNRRCWSSELHERFVEALNQLGGIEVATPKQIRDFMLVERLTIDQVKSHLQERLLYSDAKGQKYRLHCGKVHGSYVDRLKLKENEDRLAP